MFNKIQNPTTGNWVNVNGPVGRKVLQNYVRQSGGDYADYAAAGDADDDAWHAAAARRHAHRRAHGAAAARERGVGGLDALCGGAAAAESRLQGVKRHHHLSPQPTYNFSLYDYYVIYYGESGPVPRRVMNQVTVSGEEGEKGDNDHLLLEGECEPVWDQSRLLSRKEPTKDAMKEAAAAPAAETAAGASCT